MKRVSFLPLSIAKLITMTMFVWQSILSPRSHVLATKMTKMIPSLSATAFIPSGMCSRQIQDQETKSVSVGAGAGAVSRTFAAATPPGRTTPTRLFMGRTGRGLERFREGASPTEGEMDLYMKAAEDGVSVGDCPFAHFVRLVLEEKKLEYTVRPSTAETKPNWLLEHYEGKMPALRHKRECYVESSVIAEYLEFFFPTVQLKYSNMPEEVLDGFFPAVAKYLKKVDTTDEDHAELLKGLQAKLSVLEDHLTKLQGEEADGDDLYLCGKGKFSLLDCRLVPQLYHLMTGIEGFKDGTPNMSADYPNLFAYYERAMARPSAQATLYPKETVLWGWGNARK